MREQQLSGLDYLREVTTLLQRVRSAHPTAGLYEAADFQWSWRKPRATDTHPQIFWFDDAGVVQAAMIATDWGETFGMDPITMPGATPGTIETVVDRGMTHWEEFGLGQARFVIDAFDNLMIGLLARHGYTSLEDEIVESWIAAGARPGMSPLSQGYRLASRLETHGMPHHMIPRNGPVVEERLHQTSLYRADLDLVVLDTRGEPAAYGLFWFDPVTRTGLVEPMRTEDMHQRRGLARHILTSGIDLLARAGAERIKIGFEPSNTASKGLYLDVGFEPVRQCALASRPS